MNKTKEQLEKMSVENLIEMLPSPFFTETIIPLLEQDKNILLVAHGNSLRSIVMYLKKLNEEQVLELEIDTGLPIIYTYEQGSFGK